MPSAAYIAIGVFLLTYLLAAALSARYYTYMLQLVSYHPKDFIRWGKTNLVGSLILKVFPAIISFVLLFFANTAVFYIASALNVIYFIGFLPKKAKKPFKYTSRVIRLLITQALISALAVLVCVLTGSFCLLAFELVIMFLVVFFANIINKPVEKAVKNHYINEAKAIIDARKDNLTVIGITGSYGKTSTKYYLEKILSQKYNVLMTPGSYNTTMGVVRVIREMLKPSHEIFICEMGARNIGDIKEICDIVHPKHAIITSVGPQHLETFKSIENVTDTKFELADAVSDGFVVLNGDNEYITSRKCEKNCVYYGIDNKNADFTAENIELSSKGTSFAVKYDGGEAQISTRLIGSHTVLNILACFAMAKKLDVPDSDIAIAVRKLEYVPHRLQLIDAGECVMIDDAFNSNPSGAKAALDALSSFDGVKILVTPGMVELGEKQFELNKTFGAQASAVCDYIFIVGKYNLDSISAGAKEAGFDVDGRLASSSKLEDAVSAARALESGKRKYILLENDLPDNFR